MLPSDFNLAQFMEDQYAQQAQFMPIYYISSGNSEGFWNPLQFNQNHFQYIAPPVPNIPLVEKDERPTAANQRKVKVQAKPERQSSSDCIYQKSQPQKGLKYIQRFGRNINSNIFQQMLKMIKSEKQIRDFVYRIISNQNLQLTPKEFFLMLNKKMNKFKAYITLKKMKTILRGNQLILPNSTERKDKQTEFLTVLRIACRHYLCNFHIHYVYNRLKIKKDSRMGHLRGIRKILNLLK